MASIKCPATKLCWQNFVGHPFMTLLSICTGRAQMTFTSRTFLSFGLSFNKVGDGAELLMFPENFELFCHQANNVDPPTQFERHSKAFRKSCSSIIRSGSSRVLSMPVPSDGSVNGWSIFVQSVFALALNVLKHVMTKSFVWRTGLAMLWVAKDQVFGLGADVVVA
jgi:hypothetical protein